MDFSQLVAYTVAKIIASVLVFISLIAGAAPPKAPSAPTIANTPTTTITIASTTSTTTKATTTKQKVVATPKAPAKQIVKEPTVSTPPAAPTISSEEVNSSVRQTLVNILCTTKFGGPNSSISGSGVIIDARGVILTNAHVAQYFLLRNYLFQDSVVCVVRTGSPAVALYTARILYLPPTWVDANASQIKAQQALGTGENDYAFLLITGPVSYSVTLPSSFPTLAMTVQEPSESGQVLLAAYPAGFIGGATIQQNLYASSAITTVQKLYTFKDPTQVDLISLGGTIVAQSGSSGGAVARLQDGKLTGVIATETVATSTNATSARTLYAITLAHINRSLIAAGQGGILSLLTGDLTAKASAFEADIAPNLTKQLEGFLTQQ